MKRLLLLLVGSTFALAELCAGADAADLRARVAKEYPSLGTLYRELHAQPELSFQEAKTAARLAAELRSLGLEVTPGVGGHGVVGVLRNGAGPTVMVRCDLDALRSRNRRSCLMRVRPVRRTILVSRSMSCTRAGTMFTSRR